MPFDSSRPIGPDNILWPSDMPVRLQHEAEWRLATAERSRLEREVIEAAKLWRKDTVVDEPLKDVIDALINFESSQHADKR